MAKEENKRYPTGNQEEVSKSESDKKNIEKKAGLQDRDAINTSDITGPLVIFYGPREIGKTVVLLRLFLYLDRKYQIKPNSDFRNDVAYAEAIQVFEKTRKEKIFAPRATGHVDFMLLDVIEDNGNNFCQILEAPGEDFFDLTPKQQGELVEPDRAYPRYFNEILAANYRKVFVFFFEIGMFNNDTERTIYVDKIASLINTQLNPDRDRVIILCNKCDKQSKWIRDGKPNEKEFRKNIYEKPYFGKLKSLLSNRKYSSIHFVPFSSGSFAKLSEKNLQAFAASKEYYPERLWDAIFSSIAGEGFSIKWILLLMVAIFAATIFWFTYS
jgi:hypothetical protein